MIWERGGGKRRQPPGDVSAHERAVTQAVWWYQDRMCLSLWLLLHMVWSELSLGYCPPFSSFPKFLQMDSSVPWLTKGFLFEPILNLGVWQTALPIPWSVCMQFIILCSFYTAYSSNSWSSHILYANTSVGKKKKKHILEGGTFGDQITKSILWQKIQKH